MILHLPFNFDYFYKGTKSVDDFRRAMKSAINEGLLYYKPHFTDNPTLRIKNTPTGDMLYVGFDCSLPSGSIKQDSDAAHNPSEE